VRTDIAKLALLVTVTIATSASASACRSSAPPAPAEAGAPTPTLQRAVIPPEIPSDIDTRANARRAALLASIAREVDDKRVLDAMGRVPRHLFMPGAPLEDAYGDYPFPIGAGQTISQPSLVGQMTEALSLHGNERVLEIGTGSGYQAAILSLLAAEVYTIEIVPELGERAEKTLHELGYANVSVRIGDGYAGWPEKAPFDRVILTAAPPEVPRALLDQLAEGGVLIAPVGEQESVQELLRIEKKRGGRLVRERLGAVRFVPMVPGRGGARR
jgi:protein-L-isoaspartate(D-aspartate) O-methyltransferase